MKKDNLSEFYTLSQLDELINISIYELQDSLNKYTEFEGLLYDKNKELFYAKGVFIVELSEIRGGSIFDENGEHIDNNVADVLVAVTGTKYCNNKELIDKTFNLKTGYALDTIIYSLPEFLKVADQWKIPIIKKTSELDKKQYNYKVERLNQKSNFTLMEASLIASDVSLEEQRGTEHFSPTTKHYQEMLCECVKGQNQNDFHLITKELWVEERIEHEPEGCRLFENGTKLVLRANVSLNMTIISKSEFLRWCEFMEIETGLSPEIKKVEESPEQLKVIIHNLENQLNNLDNELAELQLAGMNSTNKPSDSMEHKKLESKLALLEKNTFPVMTEKLKAMLKAQKKYWIDYEPTNLTTQKNISISICETLGIDPVKGNRGVDELTKAIQPDEIKRK